MDPNANLREQEALIEARQARSARMRELREALWAWLRRRGFEPRWSECPHASRHYRSYGGSNVVPPRLVRCPWCPGFNPRDPRHDGRSHGMCKRCQRKLTNSAGSVY